MIFATKKLRLATGSVEAWEPLPEAYNWPNKAQLLIAGDIVDVPDRLLIRPMRSNKWAGKDDLEL